MPPNVEPSRLLSQHQTQSKVVLAIHLRLHHLHVQGCAQGFSVGSSFLQKPGSVHPLLTHVSTQWTKHPFRGQQELSYAVLLSQQTHTHTLNGSVGPPGALELEGGPARSLFLYQILQCGYSRSHCWSEMAQNDQLGHQRRTSLFQ